MKGDSCEHGAMTMGVARVAKSDAISPSALGVRRAKAVLDQWVRDPPG